MDKVHVYEIEIASCAAGDEVFEVGETAGAADGGGAELDGADVGLHVFFEDGGGLVGGEVRARGGVRFVGREEGFCAAFDQDGDVGVPVVVVEVGVDHEGGDVGEGLVELGAAVQTSVGSVGGVFAVFEEVAPAVLGGGVVDETTLAGTGSGWLRWVVVAGGEGAGAGGCGRGSGR